MRTIIIDDEDDSRNLLKQFIKQYCTDIEIIEDFSNPLKALSYLENNLHSVDLIFLDISMPEMDGISFLSKCLGYNVQVIFITAHSEYAIQALRLSALDYILKPISIELLINATEKAKQNYLNKHEINQKLHNYVQNNSFSLEEKKILLNNGKEMQLVKINDIIFLEADGNYTNIYIESGVKIFLTERIGNLEKLLPDKMFYRSHRSYLINLNHIVKYNKARSGAVLMSNNAELPIAHRNRSNFLSLIKQL